MKKLLIALSLILLPFLSFALEGVDTGSVAPDFTLMDVHGKTHTLSGSKGKIVVLEWFNPGCPFVKKHYKSGNMQALQKWAKDQGVVWYSVASSGEGRSGYLTPEEQIKKGEEWSTAPHAVLMDASGKVGKSYGAKTTPHMYVIDSQGKIAYQGAIDDDDSTSQDAVKTAKNFVKEAVVSLKGGKAPEVSTTEPYGCSVKYQAE